jgi:hypothetical protein
MAKFTQEADLSTVEEVSLKDARGGTVLWEVTKTITRTPKFITMNLPKLPMNTWRQIVSYMRWACKVQKSEAIVSLTVHEGEWAVIPWHQEASGGLHIKFDQYSEENQAIYSQYNDSLKKVHCTIHSHNTATAFQSGDDADDEMSKNGWHTTIGCCDKDELDFHTRYNFRRHARFGKTGNVLEEAVQSFVIIDTGLVVGLTLPEEYKDQEEKFKSVLMHADLAHPKEWEDMHTKQVYTHKPYYKGGVRNPMVPEVDDGPTWYEEYLGLDDKEFDSPNKKQSPPLKPWGERELKTANNR